MYLKMDTQGFDLEVFAGATSVLGSIVALQSEVAFRRIYVGVADFHQASEVFASAGFCPSILHTISFDEELGVIEGMVFLCAIRTEGLGEMRARKRTACPSPEPARVPSGRRPRCNRHRKGRVGCSPE